jgi:hypothetical protein
MKVTCCLIAGFFLAVSARGADELIALKATRIFDGKSNAPVQDGVVIVQGDKIVDAGILATKRFARGLWMLIRI